jgi:hypothetical protein
MDINMDDLPFVIYACFVLHNFCEQQKETVHEDRVQAAITYDREFQPTTSSAGYSNESEGKKVRRTLAKYFDP